MTIRPSAAIAGIATLVLGFLLVANGKSVFLNSSEVQIINDDADGHQGDIEVGEQKTNDSGFQERQSQNGEGCLYVLSGDSSPEPVLEADVIVLGDDVFLYVEEQPNGREREDLRGCGERQRRRANADWRAIR